MLLFFNIIFIAVATFSSLQAFDVRVLLARFDCSQEKESTCTIASKHGMTISGYDQPVSHTANIVCHADRFVVQNTVVNAPSLLIAPVTSVHHEKKIDQFVAGWYKEHHVWCDVEFQKLSDFYEKFVNDRDFRDYAPLYDVLKICIDRSIADFIAPIEHPVISYESLTRLAHQQLQSYVKMALTDAIHAKKLSKKMVQQIKTSEKIRTDFFVQIIKKNMIDFLKDYYIGLPHKILQQAVKEDAGLLSFEKHNYLGTLHLVRQGSSILLINSLDIDDYLLSVIHSEGWPGWPLEVNKALVIACRTYLVDKILQANKAQRPYHIVNSIQHQTYKGHHTFVRLQQAVDETRNVFIAYKGEPIDAMFDACCGGVIPAKIEGMNYKKHPYLARTKACTHCKRYSVYDWKKELSSLEITETLRKDHPDLTLITDIKVSQKDPAGLVKQVLVTTKTKSFYVSGKKMYSLFPAIKSFCYTIKKKGKLYLFQGKGYGHHMGLCQWGAHGMVQDNWNYKNILQFYYPDTEFMRLSLSR